MLRGGSCASTTRDTPCIHTIARHIFVYYPVSSISCFWNLRNAQERCAFTRVSLATSPWLMRDVALHGDVTQKRAVPHCQHMICDAWFRFDCKNCAAGLSRVSSGAVAKPEDSCNLLAQLSLGRSLSGGEQKHVDDNVAAARAPPGSAARSPRADAAGSAPGGHSDSQRVTRGRSRKPHSESHKDKPYRLFHQYVAQKSGLGGNSAAQLPKTSSSPPTRGAPPPPESAEEVR